MGFKTCFAGIASLVMGSNAFATFLPPNDLHLQDNLAFDANINEQEFNNIINKVMEAYKPIVAAHGATLRPNNRWSDPTVNASAQQQGTSWHVNMYGGLARRPEVTKDGFMLVVCHELGHHLGGFPFYGNTDWAASEGQSDYFATQACARKMWANEQLENIKARETVSAFAKQSCDAIWKTPEEQDLCYRNSLASQSLANLLSALGREPVPNMETPDPKEVSTTSASHPAGQCRLDTYLSGALCTVAFNESVIPARSTSGGQTTVAAEETASATSCMAASGFMRGNRPRCWYKPNLEFLGMKSAAFEFSEDQGNGNTYVEPGELVNVKFGLQNARQLPTTNVTGVMTTSSNATVVQGNSKFLDIQMGQTEMNVDPLVLKINSDAVCGSKVDVTLRASSDVGAAVVKQSIYIGALLSKAIGEFSTTTRIPDGDYRGLSTAIENTAIQGAQKITVKLNVTHPKVSELRVTLIAPSGLSKTLFTTSERRGENIDETIAIDWAQTDGRGKWQLKVNDSVPGNVGDLNSWSLAFGSPHCE